MKRKLLSLLVLLMTAATGAWAQTETLLTTITGAGSNTNPATSANVSYSTEGVATLTFSEPTLNGQVAYQASPAWGWWGYDMTLTVTPAEVYTITKCVFYDDANRTATDSSSPFVVETTVEDKTPRVNGTPILAYTSKGITKIEVYGYAPFNVTANEGASGEYWATYYNANATQGFTADANTKVFQAALTGSQLTMTEVANREIPAGKAVILKSSSSSITLTPATTTATLEGNHLVGTATAITNPGNAYVLNKGAKGVGFYKLRSTGTIGANKAYLTYSGSLAPEFFGFDGNTTSINEVRGKMEDVSGEYYDLQGRRVSQPTKGLYIVNGKKVVIK